MSDALRVGLVGCGRWGRYILRDLMSLGCEVEVVAPTDDSRVNASKGGAARIVDSPAELGEIVGAVVASPTVTHAEAVEALLPRGVPLFVEKPLTPDLAAAERILAAAPERVFVMDKWRYHKGVLALAAVALSEELGPVVGMQTTRVQWNQPHLDVDATWILLPHDLSIYQEVVGPLPPVRAAVAERDAQGVVGLVGVLGPEDDVDAAERGPWLTVDVSVRRREYRRCVRLLCRDGIAELSDGYADSIAIIRADVESDDFERGAAGEVEPELRSIPQDMPLLAELRAFVEHLRGGPRPRSSLHDAVATVRTIAALRASAGIAEVC